MIKKPILIYNFFVTFSINEMAAIHWFRKGLRVHDNPALMAACRGSTNLYPVFILDPW